jgi:hypothetical protein
MTNARKIALLLSGGIGDFLHYIARIDSFQRVRELTPENIDIYVEGTNPANIKSLFNTLLPEFRIQFLRGAIHWTKTNPLLVPASEKDRRNRPAMHYVSSLGYHHIEDWFLPFLCQHYQVSTRRIQSFADDALFKENYVTVSARDKGFMWWPSLTADSIIKRCVPASYKIFYIGDEHERMPWMKRYLIKPDATDGLRFCANAKLFIGTDTGFATLRELLGKPNVYCISEYWYEELMVAYSYWNEVLAQESRSRMVYDSEDLFRVLDTYKWDSD